MSEKGKIEKLVLRTIEWLSVIASLGLYFFFSRYLSMTVTLAYLLLVYGSLLPLCLDQLRKPSKKSRKLIAWLMLFMFYGIVPSWIFIGGIDCEPPDDADLLLPESDEPYTDEGNGWTILSNVLSRVEAIEEGHDSNDSAYTLTKDVLSWYVDPTNQTKAVENLDGATAFLSCFTNSKSSCDYIESCLKSNEWLLAGIDAALVAPKYVPPPPVGPLGYEPCMEGIVNLIGTHRGLLSARVKCEVEKGSFDTALEYYAKNLRLGTLLQTRCQRIDFLVGTATIGYDVALLERMMDEGAVPVERLKQFDKLLADLPGVSRESAVYAVKKEYAFCKSQITKFGCTDYPYSIGSNWPLLPKVWRSLWRFSFHSNRTLCAVAESARRIIRNDASLSETHDDKRWYSSVLEHGCVRNCQGRKIAMLIDDSFCKLGSMLGNVDEVTKNVETIHRKIAERVAAAQTNGTIAASGQYFPLVFTNGCYYTHDMKKIIRVERGTNSVVSAEMSK